MTASPKRNRKIQSRIGGNPNSSQEPLSVSGRSDTSARSERVEGGVWKNSSRIGKSSQLLRQEGQSVVKKENSREKRSILPREEDL